jgi:hypothetical protein
MLAIGGSAYYYNVRSKYRTLKCPIGNEPLGSDFAKMIDRAKALNGLFDEWNALRNGLAITGSSMPKYGTVDWLFREYKLSKAFTEKVAKRSRRDYEWAMREICDIKTKRGDRVGGRLVRTITPRTVLATLGGTIREGCDSPEALATRINNGRTISRVAARKLYDKIKAYVPPGTSHEDFEITRQRMRGAEAVMSFTSITDV